MQSKVLEIALRYKRVLRFPMSKTHHKAALTTTLPVSTPVVGAGFLPAILVVIFPGRPCRINELERGRGQEEIGYRVEPIL